MRWIKENWQLLAIGLLLLIIFFGGYYLGVTLSENRDYKEELKKANKEFKDLKEANKISIENVKELIDSTGIYKIFAEKERIKGEEIKHKIIKVKKQTSEKISNLDSFSVKSHLRLFTETTTRLKGDSINR